jgi:hypothetical protein
MAAQNWTKLGGVITTCAILFSGVGLIAQVSFANNADSLGPLARYTQKCDPVNDLSGCRPS